MQQCAWFLIYPELLFLYVCVCQRTLVQAESAVVAVGDRVYAGQLLCLSGDAGFCPVPHLHIEAHTSREPGAPSIPLCWQNEEGDSIIPKAGERYGPVTALKAISADDPGIA